MAGIKISALPTVSAATMADLVPVVQGGVTSKETWSQVQSLFNVFNTTVTLQQADVQGMYATPFQLIAHPGAGFVISVLNAIVYTNFQTAAFQNGGVVVIQYDNTVHGAGTNALSATIPAAEINAAASQIYSVTGATTTVLTGITDKGIFISNQTGAFTNGNAASTVVIQLQYSIIAATV